MSLIDAADSFRLAVETQRAAADPEVSAWVSASAGSGKTKVLTDRLKNLLLAGSKPQRLLCLTYTKAAAAEMATRLSRDLADWTVTDEADLVDKLEALDGKLASRARIAKARRLFAEVLDTPGGLKIQTIHAFAQSLLGRFPLEAAVPPNFRLADDQEAKALLEEATQAVLNTARDDGQAALAEALAIVTLQVGEDTFRDLLQGMLTQRARLERSLAVAGGIDGLTARVHATLGTDPAIGEHDLLIMACAEAAFDREALHAAASALIVGSKTDIKHGNQLLAWLALQDPEARALAWEHYKGVYLTGKGEIFKTLAYAQALKANPAAEDILATEANRVLAIEERLKAIRIARNSCALIRLAAAIIATYQHAKRHRALLDFEDLVEGARRLLALDGGASWVLFKLDGGLDHILIDEAQDTSPAQWEIIRALAEEFFAGLGARSEIEPDRPRTIFAVGDVKQSIYSFQGADPREFARARAYFAERVQAAGSDFRNLALQMSFRSTAAVLDAVDAVFRRDEVRAGVSEDAESGGPEPIEHDAFRQGQAGRVEVWPILRPDEDQSVDPWAPPVARVGLDDPRGRLAALLAERIAAMIGTDMLVSRGRTIEARDILVLLRRRKPFMTDLVRELKARGVRVSGVDRMKLSEQMAVADLMAIGKAVLLPDDDLTLATVLKGPLIGFTEDQLLDLCHGRRHARVWGELRRRMDDADHLGAAARRLSGWMASAGTLPPHDFYQRILSAEGGRRALVARLGPECEDAVDEFLAQALAHEREGPPMLQGFLHAIEAADLEVKRELEGGHLDQVRVMTVHGSKGLQAPIVILPDTASAPQSRSTVVWRAGDVDLPLWAPSGEAADPVAARARAEARTREEEEYRRLLYVAMTRAEDRLIVCGWAGKRPAIDKSWYGHTRAGLAPVADPVAIPGVDDGEDPESLALSCPQEIPGPAPRTDSVAVPDKPLPSWAAAAAPAEPTPPRPLAPSRPAGDDPAVRSPLRHDDVDPFKRGVLLHRLLQLLPELPAARRRDAGLALLARPVHGVSAQEAEAWVAEVMTVLDHPEFAPVFAEGSRAEVPIVGQVETADGPTIVSGRIDRLAVTADAVLIVDYKTNRPPPKSIDAVSRTYLSQLAVYRDLVGSLYPARPVRCALLWTDGPSLMRIPDALLRA
jgi:ATP-dependent helicase/nuclease subunit A